MSGQTNLSPGRLRQRALQRAFDAMALLGRPIGGIRPRRIPLWLGRKGYDGTVDDPSLWRWVRDDYGTSLFLHPGYLIDRMVLCLGAYEPPLHRLFKRVLKPGDVCLDVGANIGALALHMARIVGESGAVHCFEPQPDVAARLRAHINRNGLSRICSLHPEALSDQEGEAQLFTMDVADPNQGTSSIVGPGGHDQLKSTVTVPTLRLDDFVARAKLGRIALIKLDIQGSEPLFLSGGRNSLQREDAPMLVMEVSPEDLRHLGHDSRDLMTQVESLGYQIHQLDSSGRMGQRIRAQSVAPDFNALAVVCVKGAPA